MRHFCLLLSFVGAGLSGLAQSPQPETFSILIAGNAAGKLVQTPSADGTVVTEYSFNDRGRGPEVHGRYKFDSRGFPVELELSGHDYLKAPVDEHFVMADGEGRWRSTSEQGQASGPAFYVRSTALRSRLAPQTVLTRSPSFYYIAIRTRILVIQPSGS